jgi:hypothetical protein
VSALGLVGVPSPPKRQEGKRSGPTTYLVVGPHEPPKARATPAILGTGVSRGRARFGSAARFEYVKRGGQEGDGDGPAEIAEEAFELVWPVCDLHDREHRAVG